MSKNSTPKLKPSFRSSRSSLSKNVSSAYKSPLLSSSVEMKKDSIVNELDTTPLPKKLCHRSGQATSTNLSLVGALLSPDVDSDSHTVLRTLKCRPHKLQNKFGASYRSPVLKGPDSKSKGNTQSIEHLRCGSTKEDLKRNIQTLKLEEENLNKEIEELDKQGYKQEELDWYIQKLHEYNDVKDVAQMVMGRIAVIEETTVKHIHEQFGLNDED